MFKKRVKRLTTNAKPRTLGGNSNADDHENETKAHTRLETRRTAQEPAQSTKLSLSELQARYGFSQPELSESMTVEDDTEHIDLIENDQIDQSVQGGPGGLSLGGSADRSQLAEIAAALINNQDSDDNDDDEWELMQIKKSLRSQDLSMEMSSVELTSPRRPEKTLEQVKSALDAKIQALTQDTAQLAEKIIEIELRISEMQRQS